MAFPSFFNLQIPGKCYSLNLYFYFSKPVSEVKYRVGHKTSDVEDLNPPSIAHLKQSLATAGKTLHSRSKKQTDEDEEVESIIIFFYCVNLCTV